MRCALAVRRLKAGALGGMDWTFLVVTGEGG